VASNISTLNPEQLRLYYITFTTHKTGTAGMKPTSIHNEWAAWMKPPTKGFFTKENSHGYIASCAVTFFKH